MKVFFSGAYISLYLLIAAYIYLFQLKWGIVLSKSDFEGVLEDAYICLYLLIPTYTCFFQLKCGMVLSKSGFEGVLVVFLSAYICLGHLIFSAQIWCSIVQI